MMTCKSRIEVKIIFLLFQEDVTEVRVTMAGNRHSLARWFEHNRGPFDQLAQCPLILAPVNIPTVFEQFLKRYACILAMRERRKRNELPLIKAFESSTRQAVPEELMNGSASVFFRCTISQRGCVNR